MTSLSEWRRVQERYYIFRRRIVAMKSKPWTHRRMNETCSALSKLKCGISDASLKQIITSCEESL